MTAPTAPTAPLSRRPAILFLYVVVLVDALGMSLVFPVLPALIEGFATSPDARSYWYGALTAAFGLTQFLMSPMLGALSDRYGRRPLILFSIFGLGFDFLLMALAPDLWTLLLARLIGGATAANISVANAFIADVTPAAERTAAMGRLGAMYGVGFVIGPLVGGSLGEMDPRLPFFVAAVLSVASGIVGWFALPESLPLASRTPFSLGRANPFSALRALVRLRGMGAVVTVFTVSVLAQFILEVTWVLYTELRFGWGPWLNGVSLSLVGIVVVLMQGAFLGRLLQRFGEARLIVAGLVSATVSYLLYGVATEGWMMFAIIAANALGFTLWPAVQGLVSKSVDEAHQGVTMGTLNAIVSLTTVIAPLIGSSLFAQVNQAPADSLRIGAPYFVAAALQAMGLVIAIRYFRRPPVAIATR